MSLDSNAFPHLVDNIISYTDGPTLLALRTVSHGVKHTVDRLLFTDVQVFATAFATLGVSEFEMDIDQIARQRGRKLPWDGVGRVRRRATGWVRGQAWPLPKRSPSSPPVGTLTCHSMPSEQMIAAHPPGYGALVEYVDSLWTPAVFRAVDARSHSDCPGIGRTTVSFIHLHPRSAVTISQSLERILWFGRCSQMQHAMDEVVLDVTFHCPRLPDSFTLREMNAKWGAPLPRVVVVVHNALPEPLVTVHQPPQDMLLIIADVLALIPALQVTLVGAEQLLLPAGEDDPVAISEALAESTHVVQAIERIAKALQQERALRQPSPKPERGLRSTPSPVPFAAFTAVSLAEYRAQVGEHMFCLKTVEDCDSYVLPLQRL